MIQIKGLKTSITSWNVNHLIQYNILEKFSFHSLISYVNIPYFFSFPIIIVDIINQVQNKFLIIITNYCSRFYYTVARNTDFDYFKISVRFKNSAFQPIFIFSFSYNLMV